MQDESNNPPDSPVLSYAGPDEPPPGPLRRLLQLVVYAVVGFVVYVGAWIGTTGNFPLPLRIGCGIVAVGPIVFLILYAIYSMWASARDTFLDIKHTADPKDRRRKIVGLIVASLALTALGALRFFSRLESDRYLERKAKAEERQADEASRQAAIRAAAARHVNELAKTPEGQKTLFPSTAPAAQTLHELLYGKGK